MSTELGNQQYESFKPILDRILLRRIEPPKVEDGFTVPDKYRQHTNKGVVVAIGDGVVLGKEFRSLRQFVNVGDIVLYGEYVAEHFDKDGEELWLVRIQDVRGVERAKHE